MVRVRRRPISIDKTALMPNTLRGGMMIKLRGRGWKITLAAPLVLLLAGPGWAMLPDEPPPPKPAAKPEPKPAPKPHHEPRPKPARPAPTAEHEPVAREFRACPECPVMVVIPAGTFRMGSPAYEQGREDDEGPVHEVRVGRFALGKYEITRAEYGAFVDQTGYSGGSSCYALSGSEWKDRPGVGWREPGFSQSSNHPVVCVSHGDAAAYAEWLSRKTGKRYRLPTEAEWEYAARAGTETARYWGEQADSACRYANVGDQTLRQQMPNWPFPIHNCSDGYVYTAPVGSFAANRFGLYDMLGNVWEWTCSAYIENGYNGNEANCGAGAGRVVDRGGGWNNQPAWVRSAVRDRSAPADRRDALGFRLAQDL